VIVPDVNVLVHLYRPQDHPKHEVAQQWWQGLRRQGDQLTVPDLIWVGFVRVVTNRRIFTVPSTPEAAWAFVEALRAQGIYLHYAAHPRLMEMFGVQLLDGGATANLVTDAYIAAVAVSLGATVVTFDRDFRRFDGLSVRELG
jgi:toxin-antitoxin system PIN domain toxin